MAGNKIIAKAVPLSDRTFIIGCGELMGYLGVKSIQTLNSNFIDKGLKPIIVNQVRYWKRATVDKWIEDHNEWQEVEIKPGRNKKNGLS